MFKPDNLWLLLKTEHDRDGYALRPLLWEGPGQYRRYSDGTCLGCLVKVESGGAISPAAASAIAHIWD